MAGELTKKVRKEDGVYTNIYDLSSSVKITNSDAAIALIKPILQPHMEEPLRTSTATTIVAALDNNSLLVE